MKAKKKDSKKKIISSPKIDKKDIRKEITNLIESEIKSAVKKVSKHKKSSKIEKIIDKEKRSTKKGDFIDKQLRHAEAYGKIQQLDYGELFSYLGNSVKKASYGTGYYKAETFGNTVNESDDVLNPTFGYNDVLEIIRAAKIANTLGVEVYVNPMKKGIFDMWKLGNSSENKFLYDSINI